MTLSDKSRSQTSHKPHIKEAPFMETRNQASKLNHRGLFNSIPCPNACGVGRGVQRGGGRDGQNLGGAWGARL